MTALGAMTMPKDFKYKRVFLRGRPRHRKYDPFWRKHPPMDPGKWAKIFSPFDALAGFDEGIKAKEEIYCEKREPGEGEIEDLEQHFSLLHSLTSNSRIARENLPMITITCFFPCTDPNSEWYGRGGQYKEISGICRKISQYPPHLILDDYTIPLENIFQIIFSDEAWIAGSLIGY